jgi:hypothetical protein
MNSLTEVEVIKAVDDALGKLDDQDARDRVLRWAWAKHSQGPPPVPGGESAQASRKRPSSPGRKRKTMKATPSIVKDLKLRPKGRQSFSDFATEKKPGTNSEKCAVAVYYLDRVLTLAGITADHVYTCFKEADWRVPTNVRNTLAKTASAEGWLDTSDMNAVVLTPRGEALVDHDLPRPSAGGGS